MRALVEPKLALNSARQVTFLRREQLDRKAERARRTKRFALLREPSYMLLGLVLDQGYSTGQRASVFFGVGSKSVGRKWVWFVQLWALLHNVQCPAEGTIRWPQNWYRTRGVEENAVDLGSQSDPVRTHGQARLWEENVAALEWNLVPNRTIKPSNFLAASFCVSLRLS